MRRAPCWCKRFERSIGGGSSPFPAAPKRSAQQEAYIIFKHEFASRFGKRLNVLFPAILSRRHRPEFKRRPALESMEGRALMAVITGASAVVSSTPVGADFKDTITLTDSAASAPIGTFWYGWVPGQDFLATSPVSVAAPPGWTDQITHEGPSDGYAIQFVSTNPADDVKAGSSMSFSFMTADAPASINGNSPFYPTTPVGTSFVYPGAPLSAGGLEIVATAAPTSSPSPTPSPTSTSPVTVTGVHLIENRRHVVTQIVVEFSGPVNAAEADSVATYRLATAGKQGSFTAKNAGLLRLKLASYDGTSVVTLTPRKAFALAKPVQLSIDGEAPAGLQDSQGQLIDGNHDGQPGGNAVAVIRRGGVVLE
jgi:hypothetical protein